MEPWTSMRRQFPLAEGVTYLNHAAVSPLPLAAKAGMEQYLAEALAARGWRVSPHGYNSFADLDRLVQAIAE